MVNRKWNTNVFDIIDKQVEVVCHLTTGTWVGELIRVSSVSRQIIFTFLKWKGSISTKIHYASQSLHSKSLQKSSFSLIEQNLYNFTTLYSVHKVPVISSVLQQRGTMTRKMICWTVLIWRRIMWIESRFWLSAVWKETFQYGPNPLITHYMEKLTVLMLLQSPLTSWLFPKSWKSMLFLVYSMKMKRIRYPSCYLKEHIFADKKWTSLREKISMNSKVRDTGFSGTIGDRARVPACVIGKLNS